MNKYKIKFTPNLWVMEDDKVVGDSTTVKADSYTIEDEYFKFTHNGVTKLLIDRQWVMSIAKV